MKIPISITIEESTVSKVDNCRGLISRSRILENAIDVGMRTLERESQIKEDKMRTKNGAALIGVRTAPSTKPNRLNWGYV
jgi:hypothetical protein